MVVFSPENTVFPMHINKFPDFLVWNCDFHSVLSLLSFYKKFSDLMRSIFDPRPLDALSRPKTLT